LNPTVKETGSSGIPKWYLNPNTRIKVGFIGATATETSRDIQTAMDKAQSAARGQLRMQIQDIGESGSDRFVKETGINDNSKIIKSFEIANRSASAAVLRKTELEISDIQKDGALYRAYVLLIAPDPELESVNEMKKDQELYLEFQKTEYFKDLNERLEKFKKSQGG
ncbi:MAG: hypothetical protein ISS11_08585, partial [Candidatus Marinimicrobia bacterium]|nr:hypothetical protein [Candidatus Neomarinimicrobiota bacterium]